MGISPKQFAEVQQRIARPRRTPSPVLEPPSAAAPAPATTGLILGIDPSLRNTGWGLVRPGRPHPTAVGFGTIHSPQTRERSRCLLHILESLRDILRQHHPQVCAIESLFYAQNLQTALIMGEARGAALAALAEAGVSIFEVAPRKMKQAIVGHGGAQKSAVAKMVQRLLHLPSPPDPDPADALALALTYLQENRGYSLTAPRRL